MSLKPPDTIRSEYHARRPVNGGSEFGLGPHSAAAAAAGTRRSPTGGSSMTSTIVSRAPSDESLTARLHAHQQATAEDSIQGTHIIMDLLDKHEFFKYIFQAFCFFLFVIAVSIPFHLVEQGPSGQASEDFFQTLDETVVDILNHAPGSERPAKYAKDRLIPLLHEFHRSGADRIVHGRAAWNFESGVIFVMSVMTTIGYGRPAPYTTGGRIMTLILQIVGIPFTYMVVTDCGRLLYGIEVKTVRLVKRLARNLKAWLLNAIRKRSIRRWWRKRSSRVDVEASDTEGWTIPRIEISAPNELPRKPPPIEPADSPAYDRANDPEPEIDMRNIPLRIAALNVVFYIIIGSCLFYIFLSWDVFVSMYFIMTSITTVGFGDHLPDPGLFWFLAIFFIFLGVSILANFITSLNRAAREMMFKAALKLEASASRLKSTTDDGQDNDDEEDFENMKPHRTEKKYSRYTMTSFKERKWDLLELIDLGKDEGDPDSVRYGKHGRSQLCSCKEAEQEYWKLLQQRQKHDPRTASNLSVPRKCEMHAKSASLIAGRNYGSESDVSHAIDFLSTSDRDSDRISVVFPTRSDTELIHPTTGHIHDPDLVALQPGYNTIATFHPWVDSNTACDFFHSNHSIDCTDIIAPSTYTMEFEGSSCGTPQASRAASSSTVDVEPEAERPASCPPGTPEEHNQQLSALTIPLSQSCPNLDPEQFVAKQTGPPSMGSPDSLRSTASPASLDHT